MEKGGLVELRQRRGRIERVVQATSRAVVIAPTVVGEPAPAGQDRFAADALLAATARAFGEVAEMRERAEAAGKRLVTFTIDTEVAFAEPADIERFADQLAARVAELAAEFHTPQSGRRFHVLIGGHPASGETGDHEHTEKTE